MLSKVRSISFEADQVGIPERLPRMDIPLFVGFASAGPIGVPVPVADEAGFRRIFGDDLRLAWNRKERTWRYAYLGPSVRAFFAAGGRQCYVIRVAGHTAQRNRFLVPGLVEAPQMTQASVQARSEGAWSDGVRVGTTVQTASLGHGYVDRYESGRALIELQWHRTDQVQAGDLLRLTEEHGLTLFFAVDQTDQDLARSRLRLTGRLYRFHTGLTAYHGPVSVQGWSERSAWLQAAPAGDQAPAGHAHLWFLGEGAPAPGTVLRVTAPGQPDLLLTVQRVFHKMGPAQFQAHGRLCAVVACDGLAPSAEEEHLYRPAFKAERLTFTLWAQQADGKRHSLSGLGFLPQHPRFFGYLPTDRLLFGADAERLTPEGAALWREAEAMHRFPLAAGRPLLPIREVAAREDTVYLPLGMVAAPAPTVLTGPEADPTPEPLRNGLGAMAASLFFPDELLSVRASDLSEAIEHWTRRGSWSPQAYAAWGVEAATILALPDAVHPPWQPLQALGAPELGLLDNGRSLTWTPVDPGATYMLQRGADPAFSRVTAERMGQDLSANVSPHAEAAWYRVWAERDGERGPFSNTVQVGGRPQSALQAPEVTLERTEQGHRIRWAPGAGAERYLIQLSPSPQFETAMLLQPEAGNTARIPHGVGPVSYIRMRAEGPAATSPWSITVTHLAETCEVAPGLGATDPLLEVHAAALRLALARGDLFVLLSLPEDCQPDEAQIRLRLLQACVALPHRTALLAGELRERLGLTRPDQSGEASRLHETDALSYGAIFHPWTLADGERRILIPPDGSVAGLLALRTIERGAWAAPANAPMQGVMGLGRALTRREAERFAALTINVLEAERRGFVAVSANTLSLDRSVQQIGVRRLLILLRRLLYREGMALAFEPNDALLRRLALQRFQAALLTLHQRGALAGATPSESFAVSVEAGENAAARFDRGELVIEVQVAPERPLEFVRITLRQVVGEAPLITGG